ncbi:MAG: double-strand break repair helicase AddA [Hyphomicrobiaceae bacterium]|nr:double-strand break repair helicase AddA [Hyphomicrobiaceae bacterium]
MTEAASPAVEATARDQRLASDPAASAWVSANAGAGKTHVLKMRVLRLLLAGAEPDRILCLTFTKTAAAEMAQRVFAELSQWATGPEPKLALSLAELLGRDPSKEELLLARQLFARAVETPGGLKVQTIHAFCERLLQRFPLEAGIPPGFTILDDETAATLRREAIDAVLRAATRPDAGALGEALREMIAWAAEDGFDQVLRDALARRDWVEAVSRLGLRGGDAIRAAEPVYRAALGVTTESSAAVEQELASVLSNAELARAAAVLATGSKTDSDHAAVLRTALSEAVPTRRIEALAAYFLTGRGDCRKSLMTAALARAHPDLDGLLAAAQGRFVELCDEQAAHTLIEATLALLRLTDAVQQRYAEAKARSAALDFDDLILRTASLLENADSAQWVLYKLDRGLEHVLVDEAQDTSPRQWSIVSGLANEFFSGAGPHDGPRTVFAVGDEKQSIYSFQGAAPKLFAGTGERLSRMAAAAELRWRAVPLTLSFRSTPAVLDCVDRVFADPSRTPGLTAAAGPVRHQAKRIGQAGLVEIWPTEVWQDSPAAEAWSPLSEAPAQTPVARLTNRIADTIQGWLEGAERLLSEDRPVRAGDILMLVRKRQPFAAPMVAALKARGIPVAGSDRMQLTEQIAVEDMIALGEFLILPEDDLALAAVLKSPLFGLDDDDLLAFAPGRKGALWSALLEAAKSNPRLTSAAATLRRWRAEADFRPPYEFFATLLDNEGMRTRMLARLGPEAAEPLDELLDLALDYDDRHPPSLQGFLVWLRRLRLEIKRDQEHGRDEVRVMTVHGAKGLEAPIVFLPDTCSSRSGRGPASLLQLQGAELPAGFSEPYVWPVKGTSRHRTVQAARAAVEAAETEERNRLLYVAMTRARDRLYVAGFETRRGRSAGCWYDLIADALRDASEEATAPDGRAVLRISGPQSSTADDARRPAAGLVSPVSFPDWAREPAPREPAATIPLSPSRLEPRDTDEAGDPIEPPDRRAATGESASPSPLALSSEYRFLRGTLTHALLQHLPGFAPDGRQQAAARFVSLRGQSLPARVRSGIVEEVLAILGDPQFGAVFGPRSRAEVPIAADIPDPSGRRPNLRITGQIDRLVRLEREVLLLDYKTNRPPPQAVAGIPSAYLSQLAAYRLVISEIFPDLPIRAAILWTDGARLMPIPPELLDAQAELLWRNGGARLDGS